MTLNTTAATQIKPTLVNGLDEDGRHPFSDCIPNDIEWSHELQKKTFMFDVTLGLKVKENGFEISVSQLLTSKAGNSYLRVHVNKDGREYSGALFPVKKETSNFKFSGSLSRADKSKESSWVNVLISHSNVITFWH